MATTNEASLPSATAADWAQLLGIINLAADWVWEQDTAFRFVRLAGQVLEGDPDAAPDQLLGWARWELDMQPADEEMGWDAFRALLAARKPFRGYVLQRHLAGGETRFIRISGAPCYDHAGNWTGYRGVGEDVTRERAQYHAVRRFQATMDASPDCILVTDRDTQQFVYVNDTVCDLIGLEREQLLQVPPYKITGETPESSAKLYTDAIEAGVEGVTDEPHLARNKDGTRKGWWEPHRRGVKIDGRWMIITVSRDVSRRVLAEQAAERAKRMYAALSASNEAIMYAQSPEALYQQVCNAAVNAGGLPFASILLAEPGTEQLRVAAIAGVGQHEMREAVVSVDPSRPEGLGLNGEAYRTGRACVSNDFLEDPRTRPWRERYERTQTRSGAAIPIMREGQTIGTLFLCAAERRTFDDEIVSLLQRMTENLSFALVTLEHEADRKRAEDQAHYLATHDSLTGLPNRALFGELLDQSIRTAHRYGGSPAVMFIDLDRFKLINDSLGHAAGDALLKEMTSRLTGVLRESDVLARLGGDEFVVLLQNVDGRDDAGTVARRLLDSALAPVMIMGHECRVTASIGISLYPEDGDEQQALMKHADTAMYLAKERGKNTFEFYAPGMKTQSVERLELETALQSALANEEFFLNYQAKLDLRTNRISGVEALLRWEHPTMGMISPQQFIPICEETGAIIPIGRWVLRTACRQNVEWVRQGLPPVVMAVNLSARQFSDPDLLQDIRNALDDSGMDPSLLELELTESMVMLNPVRTIEILNEVKALGVRVALDDFGVGYSSLAQIKGFPIDTLKVDRSFIRNLPESGQDRAITEAIINMARTLSLMVVAEGVETEAQETFLRGASCDESQGFYFCRPASAEALSDLLKAHGVDNP